MTSADPTHFAALLSAAVHQIKRREGKPVRVIQDELGYALGKAGGSLVEYWRKGNLPARQQDLEILVRLLVARGAMDRPWLEEVLDAAGYGVGAAGLCDELFPPARTAGAPVAALPAVPFQAPALTPHFVGRTKELGQVCEALLTPNTPCIAALVGMGGAGKSTLAAHAAHMLRLDFPDGVLWVCAADAEPADILQTWAQFFGYDFRAIVDVENRAAAVRGIWHGRRVLIVLDDVRQMERLRPLLPGGSAAVLITTRDRDLATLANAQIVNVIALERAQSLALLHAIVGSPRVEREQAAALSIAQTVGHLPLALEIVARLLVRSPWQSMDDMAARLDDATRRLDHLVLKDVSVRAAFAVSWQILTADLRHVFTALGIFHARSCTFDAVAATAGMTLSETTDVLAALAALSLVTIDGPQRVHQHPLLADFAREQLVDASGFKTRWAAHYLEFAADRQGLPAHIDVEMDNLMAVIEQLNASGADKEFLRLVDLLHATWLARAQYALARRSLVWAIDAAERIGDAHALALALIRLGYVDSELGDFHAAAGHLEHGQAVAQRIADQSLIAEALYLRVRIAIELNALEQADEWLADCHRIVAAIGDDVGVARTQRERGLLAYRAGDYATTFTRCREALAIQERQGDAAGMLSTVRLLADASMATNALSQALDYATRGLSLAQREGRAAELAEAHFTLATVQRMRGELTEAEIHVKEALERVTRVGNRSFIAYTLYEQSVILGKQGRSDEALPCAIRAFAMQQELGDDYGRATTLIQLGDIHKARGDVTAAAVAWQSGLELARTIRYPYIEAFIRRLGDAAARSQRDSAFSGQLGG